MGVIRRQPRYLVIGGGDAEGISQVIRQVAVGGALRVFCTNPSAPTGGAYVDAGTDDGSPMANGDRLGGFAMRGRAAAAVMHSGATIEGIAAEDWSDVAVGTHMDVMIAPNGSVTRRRVARFQEDGDLALSYGLSVAGQEVSALRMAPRALAASQTIPDGYQALVWGSLTIPDGVTLTIEGDGSLDVIAGSPVAADAEGYEVRTAPWLE